MYISFSYYMISSRCFVLDYCSYVLSTNVPVFAKLDFDSAAEIRMFRNEPIMKLPSIFRALNTIKLNILYIFFFAELRRKFDTHIRDRYNREITVN